MYKRQVYNIVVTNSYLISNDDKGVFNFINAADGTTMNEVLLSLTSVHFRNIYNQGPNPAFVPWLTSNATMAAGKFNIEYADATMEKYASRNTTGGTNAVLTQYVTIS